MLFHPNYVIAFSIFFFFIFLLQGETITKQATNSKQGHFDQSKVV